MRAKAGTEGRRNASRARRRWLKLALGSTAAVATLAGWAYFESNPALSERQSAAAVQVGVQAGETNQAASRLDGAPSRPQRVTRARKSRGS